MNLSMAKDAPQQVCGDEGRIMQIVNNLVGNAIKFTGPGGNVDLFCKIFNKGFK